MEDADRLLDGNHALHGFASRWAQAGDRDHAVLSVVDADAGAADRVMASTKKPTDLADKSPSGPADVMRAPRILIVDDDKADADRIGTALKNPLTKIGQLDCKIEWVNDVASARQYLEKDDIDLYFLDLDISEYWGKPTDKETGKAFVKAVINNTNAGIIVCSNLPIDEEAPPLIEYGADDYVEKSYGFMAIAPRAMSVWRRTHTGRRSKQSHSGRRFRIGNWTFTIGDRQITDRLGISKRLSITEHIFLRHLCAVEGHAIDSEVFNIEVLRREKGDKHVRLDVFVPRLRAKLNNMIDLVPQGRTGIYKLLDVEEVFSF
ncbi:response regulator transcription factor [Bradyrhizobium canariense]|uniref:response regulator transcription factor n=1 Tax=Bradyrhizobium canariense TaxID=255045 RepID=UPI00130266AB|nr:response regulator [Bradyrhizobium canariense]